jgi:hypothetical protein
MATVNYSVPDTVKEAFNAAFSGHNKSAVIAELMSEAVERAKRKRRRAKAIEALLAVREESPTVTDGEVREAREAQRK